MAEKNIVVVTQFIDNAYNADVIDGIKRYFDGKPVDVAFLEVRSPNDTSGAFGYQYWPAVSLAKNKNINGIILITATFCSKSTIEEIKKSFQPYFDAPVVSVAIDVPFKNSYATKVDCLAGYKELISHLINVHHKKRIAFISANKTASLEARDRFEAYKTALEENGIPYNPDLVIDSDFIPLITRQVLEEKYQSKEEIDFDAVLCANDLSAFGAISFFQQLGLKVPDDIAVAGYDDCSGAARFDPPLTSLNQQLKEQGYVAAKTIDEVSSGKKVPRLTDVAVKPVYRKSCGCENFENQGCQAEKTEATKYMDYDSDFISIISLLEKVQYSQTLSEIYNLIYRILVEVDVSAFALCFYEEPIILSENEKFTLPDKIKLAMAFDRTWNYQSLNDNRIFDPHGNILPDNVFNPNGACCYLKTVFYGEKQYGYLLYRPGNKSNSLYNVYFKIINNAVAYAYEYSETLLKNNELILQNNALLQNNTELNIESRTDELTKVLNRRGFLYLGQQTINLAIQQNLTGLVIFGDMDGLKKINDNFGHDAGDLAIQAEAKILSKVFRANDVIGRMGGDEFAIVTTGMGLEYLDKIKSEIEETCEKWNKETNAKFTLSISLGAVVFDKDHFVLQDLLGDADQKQYEVKRQKHAGRK